MLLDYKYLAICLKFYFVAILPCSCLPVFAYKGSYYIVSTRNNCCEFWALDGAYLQNFIACYLKHQFVVLFVANIFVFLFDCLVKC